MSEVIVLMFVVIFSDGTVESLSEVHATRQSCERKLDIIWNASPEVTDEHKVSSVYVECLRVIPRQVNHK